MKPGADPATQIVEKLQFGEGWRQIQEEFLDSGSAAAVADGLTSTVDAILLKSYESTIGSILAGSGAMVAIGGFGRRELFPYSDVRILILHPAEAPSRLQPALSEFIRRLWDAGFRLNHTAGSIPDVIGACEQNLEFGVDVLDWRFLSGDSEILAEFETRIQDFLGKHGPRLRQHLCRLTRARHSKYEDTPGHAEPDVKETPGGLRDLQLIARLMKFWPDHVFRDQQAKEAGALISSVRCFLHYRAKRDSDLLDFEAQEAAAQLPFYPFKTSKEWMRGYFRNARIIFNATRQALDACEKSDRSVLEGFQDWQSRVSNDKFSVFRDRVYFRDPAQLDSDPSMVFRLLEFIALHGIRPAAETERRLDAARHAFAAYCAGLKALWPQLKIIFNLPDVAKALRSLNNLGLLRAIFPEWVGVEGLVTGETGEIYTADEQALITIARVGELRRAADPPRQRYSELLSEIDTPALLLFALLFQNVEGSGWLSGIQMPENEQSTVRFLIEYRMDLVNTMGARDLEDPATARRVAERIGTIERLKLLVVLTYAKLAELNVKDAMTLWRLEQLWRVYQVTRHEMMRELETDRIEQVPEDLAGPPEFIKGFPVRYLRAHSPADIQAHVRLYELSRTTGVAVQLERLERAYRLTVLAQDKGFLFASFAGAISSFGLEILKAEAFSNTKGLILDTFVLADSKRTLELNPPEAERLQDLIRRVALGKTDARRLLRDQPQMNPKKRTTAVQVNFDSEACETATLAEILAEDRPGLLYHLATVFSSAACDIDIVLIDTKGRRAIDVFYVAYQGKKLSPEMQNLLKGKLLEVANGTNV